MKKLIIQIPCYNEEETLGVALSSLPREVEGFDTVEWLIIDDGCTDNTFKVASDHGVDHFVRFNKNKGLAKGFVAGIKEALRQGADVIVNTDADNQYDAEDIPKLVKPILEGKADYVIGERPISTTEHFSPIKKLLQKLGSYVVRKASKTEIPDAPSGFRAISAECARNLNVYNGYTYTLETIIQAGRNNYSILSVPVRTNKELRPSRLFRSMSGYIKKSISTIIRIFVVYKPFKFFMMIALALLFIGAMLSLRYFYFIYIGEGAGHVQSVILASIFIGMSFQTVLIAFIADLLAVNRRLLEEIKLDKSK